MVLVERLSAINSRGRELWTLTVKWADLGTGYPWLLDCQLVPLRSLSDGVIVLRPPLGWNMAAILCHQHYIAVSKVGNRRITSHCRGILARQVIITQSGNWPAHWD